MSVYLASNYLIKDVTHISLVTTTTKNPETKQQEKTFR